MFALVVFIGSDHYLEIFSLSIRLIVFEACSKNSFIFFDIKANLENVFFFFIKIWNGFRVERFINYLFYRSSRD